MPQYTQTDRPLRVTTPLGPDAVLITGLSGSEAVSRLFQFDVELIAPLDEPVDFADILGEPAGVELALPGGETRHFHGIVSRFGEGRRDDRFCYYRATLAPSFWLLTKREQSRIFQYKNVKEILEVVLDGLTVDWDFLKGAYPTREYCVQYRESDFAFASRLMEEEGIYYYFTHAADDHTLVLADTPAGHAPVPVADTLLYDDDSGGNREDFRVTGWLKVQEVRSGKFTLWDHNFELPTNRLDAARDITDTVQVGAVTHKLRAGGAARLERYDFPGGYGEWFDGVDRGGGEQPSVLERVFEHNRRVADLRVQAEAAGAVRVDGASVCGNLTAGHKFTLERHHNADGDYVLTAVSHTARLAADYVSGSGEGFEYANRFTCGPAAVPFRPLRETPRPTVRGTQTAVVVGPAGEEIFTDKYGRVKVQFHWDREGKFDADSSCWVRVATVWAGKSWGVIHIPRIGHEVVVDFLEGDPDRPIVIGSVYNADNMPPGTLPKEGMVSGLMSRTTPAGGGSNFNGMRANDTKGKESLAVQAEYDMTTLVKHDDSQTVKNDRTITVDGTHTETIKKDTTITISDGHYTHDVKTGAALYHVKGAVEHKHDNTMKYTVTGAVSENFNDSWDAVVKNGIHIASTDAHIYIHTATSIQLHVGDSNIWMDSGGQISIKGNNIAIEGKESVSIHGGMVRSEAKTVHEISGGNVKSEAKASNVVKGAMVMLNPG